MSKTLKKLSKLELSSEEKNQRIKILENELDSLQQATDYEICVLNFLHLPAAEWRRCQYVRLVPRAWGFDPLTITIFL